MTQSQIQNFGDVLAALHAAQEAGRLVPFVGAGISRPRCKSWPDFIDALFRRFGTAADAPLSGDNPEQLYRAADRVAAWLRLLPPEERCSRLREALIEQEATDVPPQALALASFTWPLVITSNYDGIVPRALRQRHGREIRVLGRSQQDCVQVLRSLDMIEHPIVWYVQGHVGDAAQPADDISSDHHALTLLEEVVIGHQQYQHAINSDHAFRRAFSEVFRRRSLLFTGSGLAESYFVNLIAEALFSLGPSSQPHFALFCDADFAGNRIDPDFLAVRLGITPVRYGATHAELPGALNALAAGGNPPTVHTGPAALPAMSSAGFTIPRLAADGSTTALSVSLRHQALAPPGDGECVILSVGKDWRDGRFKPGLGKQARSFLNSFFREGRPQRSCTDIDGLEQGRMFRVHFDGQPAPVFLLAGRETKVENDKEARSLAAITEATAQGLTVVEQAGFTRVAMGILSAGPGRKDAAPYCLIAQLAGIREFAAKPSGAAARLSFVSVDIVDRDVWSAFAQGRIPALDLLSSNLARVLVRLTDHRGRTDEFAASVPRHSTVGAVLDAYRISGEHLEVVPVPLPSSRFADVRGLLVFPGMVIEVRPSGSPSRR